MMELVEWHQEGAHLFGLDYSFSLDLKVDGCELDDEDGSFETCGVIT